MSAHVPGYRLAELVAGELDTARVAAILNHCETCPDCNGVLSVLVSLSTNREAALEVLAAVEAPTAPVVPVWSGLVALGRKVAGWLSSRVGA